MNEEYEVVTLTDENGVEEQFGLLDVVNYEGASYVVLLPLPEDESGEVIILKAEPIEGDDENENYIAVEDEELLDAVFAIFMQNYDEE